MQHRTFEVLNRAVSAKYRIEMENVNTTLMDIYHNYYKIEIVVM